MNPSPAVHVRRSRLHGRGVFAAVPAARGAVLETCPVLVLAARDLPEGSTLDRYVFEWSPGRYGLALGAASLLNHSSDPNAGVEIDSSSALLWVRALRDVEAGEEIVIDYGYDPLVPGP